jgi:hypothetical protein
MIGTQKKLAINYPLKPLNAPEKTFRGLKIATK